MRAGILAIVAGLALLATPAAGQEMSVPGPRTTIYPGESIQESVLVDLSIDRRDAGAFVQSRSALIGRVAKKTLFAGQPISMASVEDPKLVANGSLVRMTYERSGISINASGQALQSGRAGDMIRVRNSESGIVVTGIVMPTGVVLVGQ